MPAISDPIPANLEGDSKSSSSLLPADNGPTSRLTSRADLSQGATIDSDSRLDLPPAGGAASLGFTLPTTSLDSTISEDGLFRALVFLLHYERTRDTVHLDAVIKEYRLLLQATSVDGPHYRAIQRFLCNALCEHFDLWGSAEVIEEAVLLGDVLASTSSAEHPDHVHHVCCAAEALTLRYEAFTQEGDIKRAVALLERAKADVGETASAPEFLMVYGKAHFLLFWALSDLTSLHQAIASLTSALYLLTDEVYNRKDCLMSLSSCHGVRYSRLHTFSDVSKSFCYAQSAVALTRVGDPRLPRVLRVLASANMTKCDLDTDVQFLHDAVLLAKSAVEQLFEGDRRATSCLAVYGAALYLRDHLLGNVEDLHESVRLLGSALRMMGKRGLDYGTASMNYYAALMIRFRATGSLQDLDKSIYRLQELIAETPPTRFRQDNYRRSLGGAIATRYNLLRELPDLLLALQIFEEAAALNPTSDLDLGNVGEVYHWLYQHTHNVAHLNSAIKYLQAAETNQIRHMFGINNSAAFGTALISLAQLSHRRSDWERAVQHLRLAVKRASIGHGRRPEVLRMLGIGLRRRFDALSDCEDIHESMSVLGSLLLETSSYERAKCASALAESMMSYFRTSVEVAYLASALKNFQLAAEDTEGFISDRFHAALAWATLAQHNAYHSSAQNGYRLAVQFLPRVAWVGLRKHSRLRELQKDAATLAVDAAAAAIDNGQYEAAVELLESGRGVLWSQLLQLRTDVDAIQEVAPGLATELQDVGRALEMEVAGSGGLEGERLLQRQRRLAERWEQLLEQVRKIDGFHDFISSPKFTHLLSAASEGPVIVFNASTSRCDALIIAAGIRTHHCPLPAIRMDYALLLSKFLRQALSVSKDNQGTAFLEGAVSNVLDRLWTTVGAPVWESLKEVYPDGVPRRVWFCPTGPFCLLPLHAAKPTEGPGFPDLFICSYTATLSSLIRARADREHAGQAVEAPNMLAVSQPATPGYDPLECAVEEMRIIYDSDIGQTTTFLNGSDATVASVCEEMLENAWVHFSCHGSSNTVNPLETCFRFHDGPLTLSRISELRLPHADFAFLSACHTARASGDLPDEALHLAAGLQLAGFKSVIGTQWSIADIDAPDVAKIVYDFMTLEGRYDHRSAADGLHKAVNTLRSRGVPSWRWVPFIHLGV